MAVTVTRARQQAFPGLPEQVSAARAWAVSCLPADCPRVDDVALVVSELVTNAIVHSTSGLPGGTIAVRVELQAGAVAISVVDAGPRPVPARRQPGESGWGLADIVAALADAYEATTTPAGRCAWCRLDWEPGAAAHAPHIAAQQVSGPAHGAHTGAEHPAHTPDGRGEGTR
ncbi:ATP-binding protein [Streptosporangium roseum]|uniref:Anti-sigma regulatory factor, serine/threonine protein kinase n=1 Tax=Streptosporangium roseum (strain ATCC 12428 / DSM 43021 / JCM 3005 / KCTC 9067 / NCIMB 10171 / NRRL 2505 / NI 9100) TaxID=479432 RepID=D2BFW2_STRRD|nr:ATP-binding protein [Streptosporangium roseum]ACZ92014.1 putative anti-sigma regulatory factor, serine/threonine protein kinase [Streptosporangium roseum DSM 43021]